MEDRKPHPRPDDLERRLLKGRDAAQQTEIEHHLQHCERCRNLTTSLEEQIKLIRKSLALSF